MVFKNSSIVVWFLLLICLFSVNTFSQSRELLNAPKTFYVSGLGSDNNPGTQELPFSTIRRAVYAYQALDCNGYDVTISVADGLYMSGASITSRVGAGALFIIGNINNPSACLLSVSNSFGFYVGGHPGGSLVTIRGFKISTSGYGDCLQVSFGSTVNFGNIDFGSCADNHIELYNAAYVNVIANYSISGSTGGSHWVSYCGTLFMCNGITITITNSPHWGRYFAETFYNGCIECTADTFIGASTGVRYLVWKTGHINTTGGGSNYLPGNSSGVVQGAGQYT
jgi:hypothetical protein